MVPPIRVHAITHKSLHLPGSKCPRLLNRVKRCSKGTRVKACSGAAMERGDPMPARWGPHGQELSREFGVQRLEKGLFISREWQDSQGLP